jgi:hypothetical protein
MTQSAQDYMDFDRGAALLPSWFTHRMTDDEWYFGLLLSTGAVMCISTIRAIKCDAAGALWLDVTLLTDTPDCCIAKDHAIRKLPMMTAPTTRTDATIRADAIVAAFELADT